MREERLRKMLLEALSLKALPRAGWARKGISKPESVAAHSWGVSWLVLILCPETLDRHRALAMAVIHDLPEVRCGDITPHDGISESEKQSRESVALDHLLRDLPQAKELRNLWKDYQKASSPEARFVKACDKLDMALQAEVYALQNPEKNLQEFVDSALSKLKSNELSALIQSEI